MRRTALAATVLLTLLAGGGKGGGSESTPASTPGPAPASTPSGPTVSVVLTTSDQAQLMAPQAAVFFSSGAATGNVLFVDETQQYQQIEGFGAAFTDSAAWLLEKVAPAGALTTALNNLFTRNGNGIGLSFMRIPMGASDIARSVYSYDDLPSGQTDLTLAHFSVAHDQDYIIPLIKKAKALNPEMKLMANPWSPPGWMKSSGSMIGGSLLPSMDTPFAAYFVKFIQAYAASGIPIDYISLQNEPEYVPTDYPGMAMDALTQMTVLRDHVLPALTAAGLTARVLVYDDNWDDPGYPATVLRDPTIQRSALVAGTAWHGYSGTPGAMTAVRNSYPALGHWETEHSGGTWIPNQVQSDFDEITHVLRNWGRAYVKWSLALDQNLGPHTGGCGTCTPLVTVNSSTGAITYYVEYYTLGHFSRFVPPGAQRIYSSNGSGIVSVAFLNPDQSKTLVAFNDTVAAQTFHVQWGAYSFSYTLPGRAGATFTWNGAQSGGYTVAAGTRIQASSYSEVVALATEPSADITGGYNIGSSTDGSYAVYRNVDFGRGVSALTARLACDQNNGGVCGATIEFRLDGATGPLAGRVTMPAAGGWQNWQTVPGTASPGASGVHDLYLVFKAPMPSAANLGNVNWFQFGGGPAGAVPIRPPRPDPALF
ncbi:MAG: carbohydrate-binding protein [Bryobacteraceae bacterium]